MAAVAWRLPAAAAAHRGFHRPFSTASFNLPQRPSASPAAPPEPAEPNTNLFVSGLSKRTTTERLREAFSHFGDVLHARVVTDRVTGYSKGFGFVKYATLEDAARGIEGMHGKFLDGWVIFAEYARPRPPAPQVQINVALGSGCSHHQSTRTGAGNQVEIVNTV
ncbi:hypothetical protein MLD38_022036 [Melastoma candidum]|uniref:Uncharacterized protein n=1 Tax=Melastoma candidum TaxID=119954 RepID=A0ACB9QJS7_9MYRT|nr:hypothetical protein MLD38_022036 [Melastoma candidum]